MLSHKSLHAKHALRAARVPDLSAAHDLTQAGSPPSDARSCWLHRGARIAQTVLLVTLGTFTALVLVLTAGPRVLPFQTLVVDSGSMRPTLPVGSVAIYRHETAAQVKVGQITLFSEPSNPRVDVTHRVYAIKEGPGGKYFETKGDANPAPDSWRIPLKGSGWYVVADIPVVGYLLHYIEEPRTKDLLVVVPAVLLAAFAVSDMRRPRRVKQATGRAPRVPSLAGADRHVSHSAKRVSARTRA